MALKLDMLISELRKAFAKYWATLVSVLNPDQSRPPDLQYPSAFGYEK